MIDGRDLIYQLLCRCSREPIPDTILLQLRYLWFDFTSIPPQHSLEGTYMSDSTPNCPSFDKEVITLPLNSAGT